jgi:hypothetical protein
MRLRSRDLLVDTARGIAPLWQQVAGVTRPAAVSVEQAVAALRQRQSQSPALPTQVASGPSSSRPCPPGV